MSILMPARPSGLAARGHVARRRPAVKVYVISTFLEPENLLECARIAEAEGYYGCTVADHVMYPKNMLSKYPYVGDWGPEAPFPDTLVTMAAMGVATSTLKLISAIYLLPARSPVIVAKAVATAAILTGYRIEFGVGVGWMEEEHDYTGQDFRTRGRRMNEIIELLREIWSGEYVDHHGEFFDYEPFVVPPAPKGPIPIWGGGEAPAALRRAAHLDGFIGSNYYPLDLALERVEQIQAMRRAEGTSGREDFGILMGLDHSPTIEDCKRLEEVGVTAVWASPWSEGPSMSDPGIDAVRDSLRRYADDVVRKV
jgi:probable F420-dependent oxidoreductase